MATVKGGSEQSAGEAPAVAPRVARAREVRDAPAHAAKEPDPLREGSAAPPAQPGGPATSAEAANARRAPAHEALPPGAQTLAVLLEREARLGAFLPDPYLVTDEHGTIHYANDAAVAVAGKPAWVLARKPLATLVASADHARLRAAIPHIHELAGRSGTFRLQLRRTGAGSASGPAVVMAQAVHDASGQVIGIRWLLRTSEPTGPEGFGAAGVAPLPTAHVNLGTDARGRVALLAEASSLMAASSLDPDSVLAAVAQLLVPVLGDWCVVDLLGDTEGGESVRRVHVAYATGGRGDLARDLLDHLPRLGDSRCPIGRALADGRAEVVHPATDELLAAVAGGDDAYLSALHRLRPSSCLVAPLVARGRVLGTFTFWMAESGRRHARDDMLTACAIADRAALGLENARLYRAAQRASEAKSNILAAMSHELRTPLAAVMGYAELVADEVAGPLTPAQRHHLSRIMSSGEHLLSLVNQILDLSRLEAGRAHVRLGDADAVALARSSLALVESLATMKQLALRAELPPGPVPMHTDTGKVRQILVNLLGNAIKFTNQGEVTLALRPEAGRVVFEVADTGIGMSEADLRHVFDPFWQAEQAATRKYGGTGLGLSLVRKLAQLLGGDASVTSEAGRGTRFTVWLPTEAPGPEGREPAQPSAGPSAGPSAAGPSAGPGAAPAAEAGTDPAT